MINDEMKNDNDDDDHNIKQRKINEGEEKKKIRQQ